CSQRVNQISGVGWRHFGPSSLPQSSSRFVSGDSTPAQCYRPDGDVVLPSARSRDPSVATRDTGRVPKKGIDLSGRINVNVRPTIDLHRQPTLKGDARCPSTSSSSLLLSRSASRLGYRDPTAQQPNQESTEAQESTAAARNRPASPRP